MSLGMAATGCAALTDPDPAQDGEVRVVAALYPLAWAAQDVAGPKYDIVNLTSSGGEPHDLELGIGQVADLEIADLVLYGSGFQPAVDEAVAEVAQGLVLDVHDLIPPAPGDVHDDADHDDHVPGKVDPHFWLDPLLLADVVDEVAKKLADVVPADSEGFAARAASLRDDLESLDSEYRDGLARCDRHVVVVSHNAYGYLARYGPSFASITTDPGAEPTPADLSRLDELGRVEDVTTVFYEPLEGPDKAQSVAGDLGLELAVLDPIEGLTDQSADEDYLSLMRANLAALRQANGCR